MCYVFRPPAKGTLVNSRYRQKVRESHRDIMDFSIGRREELWADSYGSPEYAMSGKLTLKYTYGFVVVLLKLITGRRAIDASKKPRKQNLDSWVNI